MKININKSFFIFFALCGILLLPPHSLTLNCHAFEHHEHNELRIYRNTFNGEGQAMDAVIKDLDGITGMLWDEQNQEQDVIHQIAVLLCSETHKGRRRKGFDPQKKEEIIRRIMQELDLKNILKCCLPEKDITYLFCKESDKLVLPKSWQRLTNIGDRLKKHPAHWVSVDIRGHMRKIFDIIQDYIETAKAAADKKTADRARFEKLRPEHIVRMRNQEFCDYQEYKFKESNNQDKYKYLLEFLASQLVNYSRIDPLSDELIPQLLSIRQFAGCTYDKMLEIEKTCVTARFVNLVLVACESTHTENIRQDLDKIEDGTIDIGDLIFRARNKIWAIKQLDPDHFLKIINKLHELNPQMHALVVKKFTRQSCDCLNSIFHYINRQTDVDIHSAIDNLFKIRRIDDVYYPQSNNFNNLTVSRILEQYFTDESVEFLPILTNDGATHPINDNLRHRAHTHTGYKTDSQRGEYESRASEYCETDSDSEYPKYRLPA